MGIYVLSSMLPFFVPILVIGAIVYLIVHRRNGENGITAYSALITYFYIVTSASIITLSIGAAHLLFVIFKSAYDGEEIVDEVTLGFTLLITGVIILLLHVFGRRKVERPEEKSPTTLRRVYSFFMLAVYSLTSLIILPLAINETILYYVEDSGHRDDPSWQLAVALVAVPIWIYYLVQVLKETRAAKQYPPTDNQDTV